MDKKQSSTLVKGAMVLTLAGIVSKILSAGYRIPLQNLTGDFGFYIYQQIYPILSMAMILGLYGFPSAISKMGADLRAGGKALSIRQFYLPLFIILMVINGCLFIIFSTSASTFAQVVGDLKLERIYEMTAFVFLLIPFIALIRGGFQAHDMMLPTAISQVSEQIVRVVIIIVASVYIALYGKDIYFIGFAANIASFLGILSASIVLVGFWFKYKPKSNCHYTIPWKLYIKTVFVFGIVASFIHMILLVVQVVDSFTLVPSLMDYGLLPDEARVAKGVFDRGYPLIQLGAVLGSSFALALIPSLSKQKHRTDEFYQAISKALSFSIYLATGAMIGLLIIFPEVNVLLFKDHQGDTSLQILAISVLLSSLAITSATILQGIGAANMIACFIGLLFLVKWYLNQFLVPFWGTIGSAIATVGSLFILCMLVLWQLKRQLPKLKLLHGINAGALLMASSSMAIFLYVIKWLLPAAETIARLPLLFITLLIVFCGASIYLFILMKLDVFSKEELDLLPISPTLFTAKQKRRIK
ncbi:MAG TPA: polysaccharide biosynthesis protein [Cerasibacillus sp.]|uniref:putative polysaccharide biosynthesis protein n=1 Tax=Cerasibacillus sp. TaxID=2498711 RepID=UPI002F3EEF33